MRRALLIVASIQFFVGLEGSLLLPLGPTLSRALAFEPRQLGYLNSAFLIAAAISSLLGSLCLDRFARRWALGFALAGLAVCTALAGLAVNLPSLMTCRFLAGLCGGPAAALGLAVIGDLAAPELRARAIGSVAIGSALALILGVPMALTLADAIGWRPMLLVIGLAGLTLSAGAIWGLPRHVGQITRTRWTVALAEFVALLRAPSTALVLSSSALVFSSTLMLGANLAPYFVFNLGIPSTSLKYIWMAGGVAGLAGSQGASRLAHKFGPTRILWALSALASATYYLLFIQQPVRLPVTVLFCSFLVCANGRIVLTNTVSSLASVAGSRGRFMSLVSATNQTASALALMVGSRVLRATSTGALAHIGYLGAFGIAAALGSAALVARLQRTTA